MLFYYLKPQGIAYLMIYRVDWMAPSSTSGYVRIGDQLDTRQTRQTLKIFLKDLENVLKNLKFYFLGGRNFSVISKEL